MMIVFDTCALLNLYNLSEESLEKVISFLDEDKDSIFLPFQVYCEFKKHYKEVRGRSESQLKHIEKHVEKLMQKITGTYDEIVDNFKQYESDLLSIVEKAKDSHSNYQIQIVNEIKKIISNYSRKIEDETDLVLKFVQSLYQKQRPKDFTISEKIQICEEAKIRHSYGYGPSKTDKDKKEDAFAPYGDYFIWKQILLELNSVKQDLIFITDEKKEDWREAKSSKTPAVILVEDFHKVCEEHTFQISYLYEYLETYIDDSDLIAEIKKQKYLINLVRNFNNKDVLVNSSFKNMLIEKIDDSLLYERLSGEAAGMGTIGDIELYDFDLDDIICKFHHFDDTFYRYHTNFELIYSGKINCVVNISKDYNEYGVADIIIKQSVNAIYNVVIERAEDKNIDKCFELDDYICNDYDISVQDYLSNEDLGCFDAENYCPECGNPMDFDDDAGNGFCKVCSKKREC